MLVLEYAPGVELFDAILSKNSFSEEEARPVFVQVLEPQACHMRQSVTRPLLIKLLCSSFCRMFRIDSHKFHIFRCLLEEIGAHFDVIYEHMQGTVSVHIFNIFPHLRRGLSAISWSICGNYSWWKESDVVYGVRLVVSMKGPTVFCP